MERARRHADAARHARQPLAQHVGRLVRERDREDRPRGRAADDLPGDAAREHPRLAGPRARDDEERPLGRGDRLPLPDVQPLQHVVRAEGAVAVARGVGGSGGGGLIAGVKRSLHRREEL